MSQNISHISRRTFGIETNDPAEVFDFYALTLANILIVSNGTYLVAGSMLSTNGQGFFRPVNKNGEIIHFLPWNTSVLLAT